MILLKKIIILFFYIIYGKIKKITRSNKSLNFKKKIVKINKNNFYNIYKHKNARLWTTSVHDTAIILNNEIVEESSFQLRYNKKNQISNSRISENIVFKEGTPKILKPVSSPLFSMLTGGAGKNNYFHWLFDVLPRLEILKKSGFKKKNIKFLVPALKFKYQIETLNNLNISIKNCYSSERYKHIFSKELISTDHPYVKKNNPSLSINNIPLWIIKWQRKNFFKKISNRKFLFNKIYISRSDSQTNNFRFILNENEVINFLKKKDFKILTLSSFKFIDQVKIFKNAKIIIGLHGAGLSNIIFCKPRTRIIEIQSKAGGDLYKNLSISCKLNYKRILVKSLDKNLIHQSGKYVVNISMLKNCLLSGPTTIN